MTIPSTSLVLCCVECGDEERVSFHVLTLDALTRRLAAVGWFLSLVTPLGELDAAVAPLCPDCARRVHHPGVISAATDILKKERS